MEMKNGKTRVWYVKDECLGRGERLMSATPTQSLFSVKGRESSGPKHDREITFLKLLASLGTTCPHVEIQRRDEGVLAMEGEKGAKN